MLDYNLFLRTMSGFGRYKPRFNVFFPKWVRTGFLRFGPVLVLGPWILKISGTGSVLGPSKKGKKTGLDRTFKH